MRILAPKRYRFAANLLHFTQPRIMESYQSIILFLLLALLAEILGTVGGFGSSLFFVPIASLFLDFYSVLGITALLHVASNLSKIALFRKGIDKKLLVRLGIPSILFVVLGAWLSRYVNTRILEISLAVFLIVLSVLLFAVPKIKLEPTWLNSWLGGSLSGMLAGLIGTGGAIRGLFFASFRLEKEIFIATSALIDLGVDMSRAGIYAASGYVHKHDLYLLPFLFAISFLGTYLGKLILNRVSQEMFQKIVLLMVGVMGLFTLAKELGFLSI